MKIEDPKQRYGVTLEPEDVKAVGSVNYLLDNIITFMNTYGLDNCNLEYYDSDWYGDYSLAEIISIRDFLHGIRDKSIHLEKTEK